VGILILINLVLKQRTQHNNSMSTNFQITSARPEEPKSEQSQLCLRGVPVSSYKGPHTEHNSRTFPLLLHQAEWSIQGDAERGDGNDDPLSSAIRY
jgi:hypothetical protein